jgi:hypothetical protein
MKQLNEKKTIIFLSFLLILSPIVSMGQRVEVSPYAGYMFAGKLNFVEGSMNIKNNPNYGVIFNFELDRRNGLFLELSYDRLDTKATFKPTGEFQPEYNLFDMFLEYYQLGALYNYPISRKASTFAVFTGGVARFAPVSAIYGDDYRFAVTFGGGVKYFVTQNFGFRLEGRLKVPFFFNGGSFYVGSGGTGFFMTSGTALLQTDISVGLIFRFGK